MGRDVDDVVDPQLKVYGVDGLRVADASIMPSIVAGNTNAPSIMIGEKCSDMVRAAARSGFIMSGPPRLRSAQAPARGPGRLRVASSKAAAPSWRYYCSRGAAE